MRRDEWQARWLEERGWGRREWWPAAFAELERRPQTDLCGLLLERGALTPAQAGELRRAAPVTTRLDPFATPTPGPRATPTPGSSSHAPLRLALGEVIAGAEVTASLGQGGMGAVYEGRFPDGRAVALKVLSRGAPGSPLDARFEREAAVLSQLDHPHLVKVLGRAEDRGRRILVLERIAGRTLRDVVLEAHHGGAPVPELELRRWLAEVVSALRACHSRGLIHRDIKPSNIMIEDGSGRAVLLDLGLAGRTTVTGEAVGGLTASLTKTGEVLGTPGYMSPEQLEAASYGEPGPASDAWAIGATLFFALTGEAPYTGRSAVELQAAVLTRDARRLREVAPRAPRDLDALCAELLRRDPRERPTLSEVEAQLRSGPARARRSPALIGGALALVVSLGGLLAWRARPLPEIQLALELPSEPLKARSFTLRGQAHELAGRHLEVNGQLLLPTPEGAFSSELALEEGPNRFEVACIDGEARRVLEAFEVVSSLGPPIVTVDGVPTETRAASHLIRGRAQEPGCSGSLAGVAFEVAADGLFEVVWPLQLGANQAVLELRDAAGERTRIALATVRLPVLKVPVGQGIIEALGGQGGPRWVELEEGAYAGNLVCAGHWVFEGRGSDKTVVRVRAAQAFRLNSGRLVLKRLHIVLEGGEGVDAISILKGSAVIEDCLITVEGRSAVMVGGPEAEVTVSETDIALDGTVAVAVSGGGLKATRCRFRGGRTGVELRQGAKARVYVSKLLGQSYASAVAEEASELVLVGCELAQGGRLGLQAADSSVELSSCIVTDCAQGGVATTGSKVHIHGGGASRLGGDAMRFLAGSEARVEGLSIKDVRGTGIVCIASKLTVKEVEVAGVEGNGLAVGRGGALLARQCQVRDAGHGGLVADGGRARFVDGLISGSGWSGAIAARGGVLELRGSISRENALYGVSAQAGGRAVFEACEWISNGNGARHSDAASSCVEGEVSSSAEPGGEREQDEGDDAEPDE